MIVMPATGSPVAGIFGYAEEESITVINNSIIADVHPETVER